MIRMPDENTTPIWANQSSQNDQATTNQTWDDFVLDFGEGENNVEITSPVVETDNLESEQDGNEEMVRTDIDLNSDDLFGEEKKDEENVVAQQDDIKIEDEKADEWKASDDFDISLEDSPIQDTQEISEDEKKSEQEISFDSEDIGEKPEEIDEVKAEEPQNDEVIDNEDDLSDKEDNLGEDLQSSEVENAGKNEMVNDEVIDDHHENLDEKVDANLENNNGEIVDENSQENVNTDEKMDISESEEKIDFDGEEGDIEDDLEENAVIEDSENTVEENTAIEDSENPIENNTEAWLNEIEDNLVKNQDDGMNVDLSGWEPVLNVENENKIDWYQEESLDNGNNSDLNPVVNNDTQESLNQPEIGDLLWDSPIDFSQEQENVSAVENNVVWEINQEPIDTPVNMDIMSENTEMVNENNQSENPANNETENSVNNELENQTFTLDYQDSTLDESQKELTENISNENVENANVGESQVNTEENQIIPGELQMNMEGVDTTINAVQEDKDQSELQQITSTLSLDQILDGELNTNPEFTDDSKAVPVNVQNKKWLFGNKKMVWILAGIGIFLLAGAVVVLAFPFGSSERKPWSVVDTQDVTEEYVDDDHQSADMTDDLEQNSEDIDLWEVHGGNATIQEDFPDVDWEDEYDNSSDWQEDSDSPNPYICEWSECYSSNNWVQDDELEMSDVLPVIADFKSSAERFYTVWDDMQDKKLIKYSLQLISVCNSYQEQIENWEWLDEVSFSSFKEKGQSLLVKIEEYYLWDDTELFISSSDNGNYWWDDDLRDYIYDRANWYVN